MRGRRIDVTISTNKGVVLNGRFPVIHQKNNIVLGKIKERIRNQI
jgi:hypothetical protein